MPGMRSVTKLSLQSKMQDMDMLERLLLWATKTQIGPSNM